MASPTRDLRRPRRRRRAAPACSCGRRRARVRASVPAKHEPGSISANRLRDETSSRRSVRRSRPIVSRTSQWSAMRQQRRVHRQHRGGVALGLEQPGADVELVGAHRQDRVVELARQRQRLPVGAGGLDARRCRPAARRCGALTVQVAVRRARSISTVDVRVAQRVGLDACAASGVSAHALARRPAGRSARPAASARSCTVCANTAGLAIVVDQPPVLRPLAAHAFDAGAEDVGQVVAHVALVGDAGQAAGAGQHAEQRHLGQADRADERSSTRMISSQASASS